ncbi:unnamed protein product [Durusdinium trenchii]|uniref:Uncharacterized protein n=1 Tax=Durusdinium trenchii TaxID=1381693 RepID=A0ABP0QNU9_9DINO
MPTDSLGAMFPKAPFGALCALALVILFHLQGTLFCAGRGPRDRIIRRAEGLELRPGRTRYVPGRRLKGWRPRGKPYDPAAGAKSRRNIGQLLVLLGALGIISRERPSIDALPDMEVDSSLLLQSSSKSLSQDIPTSPEWAFSTPVIQPGSILMSRPGDSFAGHQQYFHKSVVLMVKDDPGGDMGIIINRPTGFNTHQLGLKGPSWNIWFGGDCEGIRDAHVRGIRTFCLHVRDDFGDLSRASVDSRKLIRELREETMELRRLPQLGLDDGIGVWRHLYAVVDESDPYNDPFDTNMLDTNSVEGDALGDAMLRQWVIQNLTP